MEREPAWLGGRVAVGPGRASVGPGRASVGPRRTRSAAVLAAASTPAGMKLHRAHGVGHVACIRVDTRCHLPARVHPALLPPRPQRPTELLPAPGTLWEDLLAAAVERTQNATCKPER